MAAATSSPVLSNNGSETSGNTGISTPPPPSATPPAAVKSPGLPTITLQRPDPPKNLRGLNKPKCIKCGNVARSRCPYQSCKSCCSKAQNPCHIHVLKPNSTLADRGASPNSSVPEQQPNEAAAPGSQSKATSLRQLSSTFSQFNNVHIPVRSRKPLTRKEALITNEWRFSKLKEYKEGNIEAENEAFDRYMQNVSLLKQVFNVNPERPDENDSTVSNPPTTSGERTEIVSETKVMLRSNPVRVDAFRKRIRQTIDQGLKKLQTRNSSDVPSNLDNEDDDPAPKVAKNWWSGKTSPLTELNFKLDKARNEEDLKHFIQMKSKITGQQKLGSGKKTENSEALKEQTAQNNLPSAEDSDVSLKLVRTTEIDQDALNRIDSRFLSLEEIEDL